MGRTINRSRLTIEAFSRCLPISRQRPMVPTSAENRVALFRAGFEAHSDFVHRLLVTLGGPRADVDDLLQEVFLVAWRRWEGYRQSQPLRPWLAGIAVKVAASARRRWRWRRWVGLEEARSLTTGITPASDFESIEAAQEVYAALDALPEKRRAVLIMFEIQGMSGEEISTALGCPLKTVWTRLFHARRQIASAMASQRQQGARPAEAQR